LIEAIVIGAGQAGLAASYHLSRRGIGHVVLERDRIAESWRSQRWNSFVLNTNNGLSLLPGETTDAVDSGAFLARDAFVARLVAYADRHRAPIRSQAAVIRVETLPGGGGFTVGVGANGELERLVTRSVVVASGGQRVPRIPSIAADLPAWLRQLPAADYRDPASLPPGAVLVVGSAQTGVQITEDLLESGRTVYLCTSAVGRFPRRHRGQDFLDLLSLVGAFDIPVAQLPDPSVQFQPTPLISGVGATGHTVSLQGLAAQGAVLLGRPLTARGDRLELAPTVGPNVALGDRVSRETKAAVDDGLRRLNLAIPPMGPADPADEPHPDPESIKSPAQLSLESAGISSVVWATGYRADFSYLPDSLVDDAGKLRHAQGICPIPGVYAVGLPWQSRRRSGLISGVDGDAAFVVERLAGLLARSGQA
jgi:putative flavoprotein involved in K+ transport